MSLFTGVSQLNGGGHGNGDHGDGDHGDDGHGDGHGGGGTPLAGGCGGGGMNLLNCLMSPRHNLKLLYTRNHSVVP